MPILGHSKPREEEDHAVLGIVPVPVPSLWLLFERGEKGVRLRPQLRRRPIRRSPSSPAAVAAVGEWGDPGSVPEACR